MGGVWWVKILAVRAAGCLSEDSFPLRKRKSLNNLS